MSGLVGYIGDRKAAPVILDVLSRLEYRGYDSSGIAALSGDSLKVHRTLGRPAKLAEKLKVKETPGNAGIGHTRWASHGKPSIRNAHPLTGGKTAVVHNGILEGADEIKKKLIKEGAVFRSETDTEVIPHLIDRRWRGSLLETVLACINELKGGLTCAIISSRDPDAIVIVKKGNPVVVGFGDGEYIAASDATAIAPYTDRMVFLEDGEIAVLSQQAVRIYDFEGKAVEREPEKISWNPIMAEKRGYRHFFLKEIVESPRAVRDTIASCLPARSEKVTPEDFAFPCKLPEYFKRALFLGGGLSYSAAMLAQWLFESMAGIPTSRRASSEVYYSIGVVEKETLYVAISQSGETLDTLEAARYIRERGGRVLAITNNASGELARIADYAFITQAGPEISIASSKTFSTAVTALTLLAFHIGRLTGHLTGEEQQKIVDELLTVPGKMEIVTNQDEHISRIADKFSHHRSFFFVGRSFHYPVAFYAAFLMKQVANVHAEGLVAGEIKHGPISLVEQGTPIMFFANQEAIKNRIFNDMDELRARGARIIATGFAGSEGTPMHCEYFIEVPKTSDYLAPLLAIVPAQLFIYYVALYNRKDIDHPRNMAKSVTV